MFALLWMQTIILRWAGARGEKWVKVAKKVRQRAPPNYRLGWSMTLGRTGTLWCWIWSKSWSRIDVFVEDEPFVAFSLVGCQFQIAARPFRMILSLALFADSLL